MSESREKSVEEEKEPLEAGEFSEEILKRVKADQDIRFASRGGVGEYRKDIDKENTAWLKGVVEKHGWPTISMVGKEASEGAWLLVKHADSDVDFQEKCLDLMKRAGEGEVEAANIVHLEDRVLVNKGEKQIYGTQFYTNKKGEYGPRPIKDKDGLNKRRKHMGLEPFEEYEEHMADLKKKEGR